MSITRTLSAEIQRPRVYNIDSLSAGDSLSLAVSVRDRRGRLLDLTGATARWAVAPVVNARLLGTAVVTLSSPSSGIVIAGGVCTITMAAGTITAAGEYRHEMEIVLSGGASVSLVRGRLTCVAAVLAS